MKSFTSVRTLGRSDLDTLIDRASLLRDTLDHGETVAPALAGLCVANLFFEPSTRTRISHDLAAQKLGAHVITLHPEVSSTSKGESLRDTVLTVAAIGADILVVRHENTGVPQLVGEWTGLPVINAGDGTNEHPTQTLLDTVTLRRHFGELDGLRMAVVGDIAHSRVAAGLVHVMPVLGVDVTLVGPKEWLPGDSPVRTSTELGGLISEVDVLYLLRVQTERGGVINDEYVSRYRLDATRAAGIADHTVIMHAGPINRGVEISEEMACSPRSLITEQVRNGVPTRMAVFEALARERA